MTDDAALDDPLKELAAICEPDSRQSLFAHCLQDLHGFLKNLQLHAGVPKKIRQLFETAKNLCLYSWFVYPFHQVAEMTAFSALEFALRVRAGLGESEPGPGLSKLLKQAQQEGWLSNERFACRRQMGINRARDKITRQLISERVGTDPIEVPDPSNGEIERAIGEVDVIDILVRITPKLRNSLAHGSSRLHPGSTWTLQAACGAIAQLFPAPTPALAQ